MTEYLQFLETKKQTKSHFGWDIEDSEMNTNLFNFQKFGLKRAIKEGKFAIWFDCGMGKTIVQLDWARLVVQHTDKPVLILAPLAVIAQTINQGVKFGIEVCE